MGYKRTLFQIARPVIGALDKFSGVKQFGDRYICAADRIPADVLHCVVFGAGLREDRSVSLILRERLDKAIETGTARRDLIFLLTGGEDEVEVMKNYLLANSTCSESRILCDGRGYTTYQSLCHAKEKFGIDAAMAVSNSFHLPRCVFIGRMAGMKIWGVEIPPKNMDRRRRYEEYESVARIKAWLQARLLGWLRPLREFTNRNGRAL
jgi:SanA protein